MPKWYGICSTGSPPLLTGCLATIQLQWTPLQKVFINQVQSSASHVTAFWLLSNQPHLQPFAVSYNHMTVIDDVFAANWSLFPVSGQKCLIAEQRVNDSLNDGIGLTTAAAKRS